MEAHGRRSVFLVESAGIFFTESRTVTSGVLVADAAPG